MAQVRSFRDLLVWQRAMDLTVAVYRLAESFPTHERYGLWSQATRAAVSVPANIAEGHARTGEKAFAQYLGMARGSLAELESLLMLAERLGYLSPGKLAPCLDETGQLSRMLAALSRRLRARANPGPIDSRP